MKYNDYIILTDEDYNNMKSKYNILDELDKEKLLDIYNSLTREYVVIESSGIDKYNELLHLTKKHIDIVRDILNNSGVETASIEEKMETVKSASTKTNRYYNPLSRLFMLNRRPMPPRPPFNPNRNELDIIDLMLLYLLLRPHGRHNNTICNMAHERIGLLSKFNVE